MKMKSRKSKERRWCHDISLTLYTIWLDIKLTWWDFAMTFKMKWWTLIGQAMTQCHHPSMVGKEMKFKNQMDVILSKIKHGLINPFSLIISSWSIHVHHNSNLSWYGNSLVPTLLRHNTIEDLESQIYS